MFAVGALSYHAQDAGQAVSQVASHVHGHTMWEYLGSFIFYTLLVIGFLYATYFYLKKNPGLLTFSKTLVHSKSEVNPLALLIESRVALEPRKTAYVLRSGNERFLVAASGEQVQLLSKLSEAQAILETVNTQPAQFEEAR